MKKLLINVVKDIQALSVSLQALAEVMEEQEPAVKEKSEQSAENGAKISVESEAEKITLEAVRAALAEKSRSGFTAEVKELIRRFGAEKLSDIDESRFVEVLAEAEAIV